MKLHWPLILVIIGIVLIAYGATYSNVSSSTLSYTKFTDTCKSTGGQISIPTAWNAAQHEQMDELGTVCTCPALCSPGLIACMAPQTFMYKDFKDAPGFTGCVTP